MAHQPKWAPSVTAILVSNAVKATVVVFTDTLQRCICFFGTNANQICVVGTFLKIIDVPYHNAHLFITYHGT